MSTAYARCTSGHYHVGEYCVYDGASSDVSRALTRAVRGLTERGQPITLETLRASGLSDEMLQRVLVLTEADGAPFKEAFDLRSIVVGKNIIDLPQR